SILEEFVERFRRALDTHWPNSILSYSFKTNSLPWLLAFMEKRGVWAEVVSDFEYRLALAVGYAPEQIVFNGPVKSRDCLREALCEGSLINLDSKREVRWTAELAAERPDSVLAVGLRVNWDLEARIPGESTMRTDSSRFGFSPDNGELGDAISALEAAGVRVAGLHMHRSSLTQSLEVYKASASVAPELISSVGLDLDWIAPGGSRFGRPSGGPTCAEFGAVSRGELAGTLDIDRTQLIVEPGGSLFAVPIEFHAQVIDVKYIGDQRYIVIDASRTDIDPLFRRKRNFAIRVDPAGEATAPSRTCPEQVICGFTCMEDDRLTVLEDAQERKEGDRRVFYRVGD